MNIIICVLLFIVVGMLGTIGYMLYKFLYKGIPIHDEKGRYMTDVDINALLAAQIRMENKSNELVKEYIPQDLPPLSISSNLTDSDRPVYVRNNILIPYNLTETEKQSLEEFYR